MSSWCKGTLSFRPFTFCLLTFRPFQFVLITFRPITLRPLTIRPNFISSQILFCPFTLRAIYIISHNFTKINLYTYLKIGVV